MGPLPDADAPVADGLLERYEALLAELREPLSPDEAKLVAPLFPKSACFGLEWTLVHLLERSEGWPSEALDRVVPAQWRDELIGRIERSP